MSHHGKELTVRYSDKRVCAVALSQEFLDRFAFGASVSSKGGDRVKQVQVFIKPTQEIKLIIMSSIFTKSSKSFVPHHASLADVDFQLQEKYSRLFGHSLATRPRVVPMHSCGVNAYVFTCMKIPDDRW